MLAAEGRHEPRIAQGFWIDELALDLRRPRDRFVQPVAEAQAVGFPYFCRKRSTRPAVSTIFCLPVKNGWQFEQMSV
jgi:hypothetical protein